MEIVAKLQCPQCQSRLDVFETSSGGRTISVATLGLGVERTAIALETFLPAQAGPRVVCPACRVTFDPSEPYRSIPALNPSRRR